MSNQDMEAPVFITAPAPAETPVKPKKKARKKPVVKAAAPKKAKRKMPVKAKRKAKKSVKAAHKQVKRRKKAKAHIRNKLYKLCKARLPRRYKLTDGELNIKAIVAGLKMTPEGVYKWFRTDRLTPTVAKLFMKLAKGKIKIADVIPFVF
jgi:hypothetical protein